MFNEQQQEEVTLINESNTSLSNVDIIQAEEVTVKTATVADVTRSKRINLDTLIAQIEKMDLNYMQNTPPGAFKKFFEATDRLKTTYKEFVSNF